MLETEIKEIIGDQELLTMSRSTNIVDAAKAMARRRVGALLVMDGGKLAGIFTDHDMIERVVGAGMVPKETLLREAMTPDPVSITADDTALQAIFTMRDHGTRHLPVKDGSDLIGIVSVRDLLRSLVNQVINDNQRVEDLWEGFPV